MQIEPQIINAIVIIIVASIIMLGIVSVLAPAALAVTAKPLLDIIASLIALLEHKPTSKPSDDGKPPTDKTP